MYHVSRKRIAMFHLDCVCGMMLGVSYDIEALSTSI